ncbi:MAG: BlaI/MecI/CopY family transcriptional regulator [Desulfurococcales archaeon]|nr:BlaI/MecI/CopY family transcriptional regulator [Desulfurococcales archaeon]
MSSPEQACRAARLISEAMRPERGGSPSYRAYHVIEALRLASRAPVGRPYLSRRLGLGETPAKTLIGRLERLGLLKRTPKGRHATPSALEILAALQKVVHVYPARLGLFNSEGEILAIIEVLDPPEDLTGVYQLRDYLVARGCRVSIIGGIHRGGSVSLPGVPEELASKVVDFVGGLGGVNRGVIIAVPSPCIHPLYDAIIDMILDSCTVRRE